MRINTATARVFIFGSVAVALLIFLPTLLSFVHGLSNVIVGSRSPIKIFLAIVFICLVFILKNNFQGDTKNNPKKCKVYLWAFIFVAVILYSLNIFSFVYFTNTHILPKNDLILVFNHDEISSSRLIHNHVLKGAMGLVSMLFSDGHFENTDVGTAFVGLFPAPFYVFILFLLCLLLFLSLILYIYLLQNIHGENRIRAFTILYALTIFVLITRVIDGGIWADSAIVAIFSFIFLIPIGIRTRYIVAAFIMGFYITSIGVFYYLGVYDSIHELYHSFYINLACTSIFLTLFAYIKIGKVNRLIFLLLSMTFLFLIPPLLLDNDVLSYRAISLTPDSIVGLYATPKNNSYSLKEKVGALSFYSPDVLEKTVGTVINNNDLLDNLYPVSVPWHTCFPQGRSQGFTFSIATPNVIPPVFKTPTFVHITGLHRIDSKTNFVRYTLHIAFDQCYPRHLNIIDELFKINGMHTVIMYNILFDVPTSYD